MMNQEHQGANSVTPEVLSGKRKRGRPRKDDSVDMTGISGSDVAKSNRRRRVDSSDCTDTALVGQVVSGVLDGSFDAGYLLTVRVGETGTVLRGVVFEPGLSVPISAVNDVAPHIKMIRRNEVTSPLNQVSSLAVGQNPSKLLHVNEAAHPSEGSPTNRGPKVQKYDGSSPLNVPEVGPSNVTQGTPSEMQYESKTDTKVEISIGTLASQPQTEKGNFVVSMPVDETSLLPKGADCDINESPMVTLQTPSSEVKANACNESAVVTSHTDEAPGDSCDVIPSRNQEPSIYGIDSIEVSQDNESSIQVEGPSNVEPAALDTQLELASVPSAVKIQNLGATGGTLDAVNQDTEAMLVDVSANCVSKVPALVPQGEPLEASDEIQKPDEAPHLTAGPTSDAATVSKEDIELDWEAEVPVEDVDMMQTNPSVTQCVELLQSNATSAVEMLRSNISSAVEELQPNVTTSLEMSDAGPTIENNPQDETSHVTEAAEDASKDLESPKKIVELVSVGGSQREVTASTADDMPNESKQKEPVLLDLMGPAFSNETVLEAPNHEDPAADVGGLMELGRVADQSIDIIVEGPSRTGSLPQNG